MLVVRPDLIGDFLLFTPALEALRRGYEGRRIILVVQKPVVPLLEGCPHVDHVIALDEHRFRRAPLYRLAMLHLVHRLGATTALYPCYSRTGVGDMLIAWSAAGERVGWDSDVHHLSVTERRRGDRQYTRLVYGRVRPDLHEIERNLHFLRDIGIPVVGRDTKVWYRRQPAPPLEPSVKRIAILPGASFPIKKWGAARFNKLIRGLAAAANRPLEFILCGQRGDADGIAFEGSHAVRIVDMTGRTTLPQLGDLFAGCAVVVGNDTGTMHLAIASGAPTVCIIGGGHFGRFMPYGNPARNIFLNHPLACYQCGWHCVREEPECITHVAVGKVVEACVQWI